MSYTPTTWNTGDTITAAAMNKIEQGIAEGGSGYDLIVVVDNTHDPLQPGDCEIVKGDILALEQKVADGEMVTGVCLLREYYSWTSGNITQATLVLPLVYWFGPYAYLGFGGSYKHSPTDSHITMDSVCVFYDYTDGSVSSVTRLKKTVSG